MSGLGASWPHLIAVAGGASVGAVLRWQVGRWLNTDGAWLPWGTLLVNCAGGLLIGLALVGLERVPNEIWRLLLVTGFLGGLTTFSAFSAESWMLIQRGEWGTAVLHSAAHVFGALGSVWVGSSLGRVFWSAA